MKIPQQTKESLAIELAKVRQSHADWVAGDERRRKEFAKAFNWIKNTEFNTAGTHIWKEPQLPSWEQIFVQIGRLLVVEELKQELKDTIISSMQIHKL